MSPFLTALRVFLSRVVDVLLRRQRDDRLSDEMQAHLEMLTDDYVAAGLSRDEARFAARRDFGGMDQVTRLYRDQRGLPGLDGLLQDLRFAARLLVKDRRFTLAAVVALGLGIGVTNTVFTIVNAAMFRDLPFDQPDRLVSVSTRGTDGREQESYLDFRDLRDASTTFSGLAASAMAAFNLSDEGRAPERLRGTFVSANLFRVLRAQPILGRDFRPEDDRPGAPPVVIISYGVWQERYGGEPSALGRTVKINDVPATIVGVMPVRFGFPALQDAWQPLALLPGIGTSERDARRLMVFGRLADTADLTSARAEIATIAAQLARAYPQTNKPDPVSVVGLRDRLPQSGPILLTLLGAVGFVLLIACANVANLLLARSVTRSREIAIRASLGATRWRIVRQLLIECVLVASLAGILGAYLSVYGVKLLGVAFDVIDVAAPGQSNTPYWVDLSMNAPVYLFLGALCLLTAFTFGLVPALHISKTDVNDTLKDGGRGGGGRRAGRWTGAFVTAELALTLVLLSGAGLLWRSFLTNYQSDRIIDTTELMTMRLGLPAQKYATPAQVHRFFTQLDERLAARPDRFRATIASYVPYATSMTIPHRLAIDGREFTADEAPAVLYAYVGPRYFETIGLRITRGRAFAPRDERPAQEGAIVDERFVARFFPDGNAIGQRIQVSIAAPQPFSAPQPTTSPWLTIVGVVPTLVQYIPGRTADPVVFVPLALEPLPRAAGLIARRSVSAEQAARGVAIDDDNEQLAGIVAGVRDEIRALDPDLPAYAVETMETALARTRFGDRLMSTWFGMLAGIALTLATVGLYALTAYNVASRTQEIGVRMALGAKPAEVVWLFLRRAVAQLAIGLTLGLAGALATGQLLASWHRETHPRDPATLAIVSAVLVIVSVAACVIPARRAARLDPVAALREE